jgi:hypothetical protein
LEGLIFHGPPPLNPQPCLRLMHETY